MGGQGPGGYGGPPGGGYGGPPPGGGYGGPPPGGGYGSGGPYGPPPQAPFYGGGPQPGYPAPGGGYGVGQLAALTERSPVTVILLTFVTCGIYALIWKFQTTDELRVASGDESIKPGMDLLLALVTCGIWAIYTDYRNAKKCYELSQQHGLNRSDQSTIVILTVLLGVGIVGWYLLQ